ncbi:hypothetical protein ACIQI8_34905 [Streptomyces sp. NPDC092369]|uniref:hypothetical protein n=1 Tax=Streptomyces sp. NPDC092369 TaxID=3366015 RepID=UPI00382415CE
MSDSGGVEREYGRRRPMSWSRRGFLVITLGYLVSSTLRDSTMPGWARALFLGATLALIGTAGLGYWRGRTFVRADGISARGAIRVRRRAWQDVYAIRIEPAPTRRKDGPRLLTYLYDNDGRRLQLVRLDDWQWPDLEAEVDDLRTAAARHRGTGWESRPEAEDRVRRRAGHRTAWVRAFNGALFVLLAMVLFMLWELLSGADTRPLLLLLCIPLAAFALLAALLHWRWESQVPWYLRETPPVPPAHP